MNCQELFVDCPILIYGSKLLADLYRFKLTEFDIILGMDWLSKHQAQIDCLKQNIILRGPKGEKIVHRAKPRRSGVRLMTEIRAQKLLKRGCEGHQCIVVETETPVVSLRSIPVVQEFPDVFSEEILGMPPPREVEFCIDLVPGALHI